MSIPKTAPDPAVNAPTGTPNGVPDAGELRDTYANDQRVQRDDRRLAEQLAREVLQPAPTQPDKGPGARDRKQGA